MKIYHILIIVILIGLSCTLFINTSKSYEGYNLYYGFITDMEGNNVRELGTRFATILSDGTMVRIHPDENGLERLTLDGELIWGKYFDAHHDIYETNEGTILVGGREIKEHQGRDFIFDIIFELNISNGEEVSRWSFYDNMDKLNEHLPPLNISNVRVGRKGYPDYYHLNSIQKIDDRILFSINKFDGAMFILNPITNEITWSYHDAQGGIHMPRMLDDGNILYFSNGELRNYSRVSEINPDTLEEVWFYEGSPKEDFYSSRISSAQRLPNGNTLITEGFKGYVFEVTPNKEKVWEWWCPVFDENNVRQRVYRMTRYDKEFIEGIIWK